MNKDETELSNKNRNQGPILAPGIGTRIREAVDQFPSQPAAADAAGVSVPTLQRYMKEGTSPTFEAIYGLSVGSGISMNYIASGVPEGFDQPRIDSDPDDIWMFAEERAEHYAETMNANLKGQTERKGTSRESSTLSDFSLIPLYDVSASAGPGAAINCEEVVSQLAFRKDWLRQEGLESEHLAAVTAVGDSMEPKIRTGAILLLDTTKRKVGIDDVYVLRLDDHLLAKRLQRRVSGEIRVMSDNKAYEEEIVPEHQVSRLDVIGRVVWIGQKL